MQILSTRSKVSSRRFYESFTSNKRCKSYVRDSSPPRKCAYQAFIIQNLDVVALELGMKVQFANF
jgi:hypothetical protein